MRRRPAAVRGVVILLIVAAGLVALRLLTVPAVELPLLMQDFVTLSVSVAIEAFPFVILGIVVSALVQLWLPPQMLFRLLPKRQWPRRIVISLLGFLFPVCECGNVPLTRGFIVRGVSVSESITFLLAAPILNPVTIITTQQAFGGDPTILIARLVAGFVIANAVGWVFSRHHDQPSLLTARFQASCEVDHGADTRGRLPQTADLFARELSSMLPALLLGSVLAGGIQVLVPRELLTSLGEHPVLSILAMMALGFIVSICSNVDAFFALSFASTFLPGALTAFLVFGPMIDIKMLMLMRTTFRTRTLVLITLMVAVLSFLTGLVVNLVV